MSYSNFTDVINRFKPLVTMIGSASTDVSTDEVSSHYIAFSDGIIDGYLSARYVTPLNPVPSLITMISADLSIHALVAEKSGMVPEWMDKRYDRCLDLLAQLRDGEMVLPNSVSVVTTGDNYAYSTTEGYHGIFSPVVDELDQAPDIDRVRADKDAREDDPGVDSCP